MQYFAGPIFTTENSISLFLESGRGIIGILLLLVGFIWIFRNLTAKNIDASTRTKARNMNFLLLGMGLIYFVYGMKTNDAATSMVVGAIVSGVACLLLILSLFRKS